MCSAFGDTRMKDSGRRTVRASSVTEKCDSNIKICHGGGTMTNENTNDELWLLPIFDLDGIEYFVDIDRRQFSQVSKENIIVPFHSQQGRAMVKAMLGMEWRKHGIDNLPTRQMPEGVCPECGGAPAAKT